MEIRYATGADGNIKEFIIGKTRVMLKHCGKYIGTIISFDLRRSRCYRIKWDNNAFEDTSHHSTELLICSGKEIAPNNPNTSFKAHRRKINEC